MVTGFGPSQTQIQINFIFINKVNKIEIRRDSHHRKQGRIKLKNQECKIAYLDLYNLIPVCETFDEDP